MRSGSGHTVAACSAAGASSGNTIGANSKGTGSTGVWCAAVTSSTGVTWRYDSVTGLSKNTCP